jgi:hypothetical protein
LEFAEWQWRGWRRHRYRRGRSDSRRAGRLSGFLLSLGRFTLGVPQHCVPSGRISFHLPQFPLQHIDLLLYGVDPIGILRIGAIWRGGHSHQRGHAKHRGPEQPSSKDLGSGQRDTAGKTGHGALMQNYRRTRGA